MKLENWSLVIVGDVDPYTPPELVKLRAYGKVYGHPNFKDGDYITTSSIVRVDNGHLVTHFGSEYELGEVDPNYEKRFPNARERVLLHPK